MNSEEFFKNHKEFNGKTGIYVLESPLKFNNKEIFKVGYAYQSLYKRIRDYKTAYGPIEFKIHIVYEIPQRIFGDKRTMVALGTEKQLHQMLHIKGNAIMVKENNKLDGEWFYDLESIYEAVNKVRIDFLSRVKNSDTWLYFDSNNKAITRSKTVLVPNVDIMDIKTSFTYPVRALSKRNKPKKSNPDFEEEHNPSRNKFKDKNIANVKV